MVMPALAFQVHRVERLFLEIARSNRPRDLHQPVGERRLSVVDVRDDAEVADVARDVGSVRTIGFQRHGRFRRLKDLDAAVKGERRQSGTDQQLQDEQQHEKGEVEAADRRDDSANR